MTFKKLITITSLLLVSVFGAFFFVKQAGAQTLGDHLDALNMGEGNMEQWGQASSDGGLYTLLIMLVGEDNLGPVAKNSSDRSIAKTGAVPFTSSLVGLIYGKPVASGVYYAQDILQKVGGKPAYAQGVGFTGLQPILSIWKAFRNVAYVLLTIVFVVIGVGIMFRVKISPQAVITIENAIPKLIGGLILITFSYAIAGFAIDLMYVIIALGINILRFAGVEPSLFSYFDANLIPFTPQQTIKWGFFAFVPMFLSSKPGITTLSAIMGGLIGAIGGAVFGGGAGTIPGALIGIGSSVALVAVIILVISLFLIFKLFFGLVKAYIRIIIAVMFAPIQILAGTIPGVQAGGFGGWIKGLFTEILIFPAVAIVGMIAAYLLQQTSLSAMWTAPLIGFPGPSGGGGGGAMSTTFTQAVIGMGFLLILSNIPDIVRNAMGTKDLGYGTMLGKTFAGPIGTLNTGKQMGSQLGIGAGLTWAEKRATRRGLPTLQKVFKNVHEAAKNLKVST